MVLAFGAFAFLSTTARAQGGLPPEIWRSPSPPGSESVAQIKKFITERSSDLAAQDSVNIGAAEATRIKRARQDLLQPLADPQVSAPFRLEYGKQLEPLLSKLAADKRDMVAINALLIAGELATEHGVSVLEKQAGAKDPVVRYTAARGVGLTFEAIQRSAPALTPDRVERMIKGVGERLAAETDPRVLDTLSRALVAASKISQQNFQSIPATALTELGLRLGSRLKVNPDKVSIPALLDTALTAGVAQREALSNPATRLPDGARREAGAFAGDLLALIARAIKAGKDLSPVQSDDLEETKSAKVQSRVLPAQAVALAEAIIALASDGAYKDQHLGDLVKPAMNGDDAKFLVGAGQLIGPDGVLTKPPFGVSADRFRDPK